MLILGESIEAALQPIAQERQLSSQPSLSYRSVFHLDQVAQFLLRKICCLTVGEISREERQGY